MSQTNLTNTPLVCATEAPNYLFLSLFITFSFTRFCLSGVFLVCVFDRVTANSTQQTHIFSNYVNAKCLPCSLSLSLPLFHMYSFSYCLSFSHTCAKYLK